MREPTIQRYESFETDELHMVLKIPRYWLIFVKYPRLKLWWFLTKLVWKI